MTIEQLLGAWELRSLYAASVEGEHRGGLGHTCRHHGDELKQGIEGSD